MSRLEIESASFQATKQRFDLPALFIIIQSGFRFFWGCENDQFAIGHFKANQVQWMPPNLALAGQNTVTFSAKMAE